MEATELPGTEPRHSFRGHAAQLTDIWNFIVILNVVSLLKLPKYTLKALNSFIMFTNSLSMGFIIYYIKIDLQTDNLLKNNDRNSLFVERI